LRAQPVAFAERRSYDLIEAQQKIRAGDHHGEPSPALVRQDWTLGRGYGLLLGAYDWLLITWLSGTGRATADARLVTV